MSRQYLIKQFSKRPHSLPDSPSPLGIQIASPSNSIDGNTNSFAFHNSAVNGTPSGTAVDYVYTNPLGYGKAYEGNLFIDRIRVKQAASNGGRIKIVHSEGTYIKSFGNAANFVTIDTIVRETFFNITELTVELNTEGTTSNESKLYNVYIEGMFGPPDFEFNDSVLTTKGWNSSRYDGKQLRSAQINEFTPGDTAYGKTPAVRKYSRNIYLGSRVIGLGEEVSTTVEDSSLTIFPGFSYITVHEFLTVNDDLTVTRHTVTGDIPSKPGKVGTNNRVKKGWYKSWYDDFPIGSNISLRFFDEKLETSLDSQYSIFFNGGQLKKMLHIRELDVTSSAGTYNDFTAMYIQGDAELYGSHNAPSNIAHYYGESVGSEHRFFIKDGTGVSSNWKGSFTIFNKESIVDKFFKGSLVASDITSITQTQGK